MDRSDALHSLIMTCSASEMTAVMDATLARMHQLYPDDEVVYLILPCSNDQERHRIIDAAASLMKQFKRNPHWK